MVQLVLTNVRGQNTSQVTWNITIQHCVEVSGGVTDDAQGQTETDGEEAHHLPGLRAPIDVVLDWVEDGNKSVIIESYYRKLL